MVNPYSCDETHVGADYTDDQLEFLKAVERYKRTRRRKYLSNCEVLDIVKSLGYRKFPSTESKPHQPD